MTAAAREEELLRSRSRALAATTEESEAHLVDHLLVRVGEVRLALEINSVREVLPAGAVTPIVDVAGLVGVRNLRGGLIAIADLGEMAGVALRGSTERPVLLLAAQPGGPGDLGVLVDEVIGVERLLEGEEASPVAEGAKEDQGTTRFLGGVVVVDVGGLLQGSSPPESQMRRQT